MLREKVNTQYTQLQGSKHTFVAHSLLRFYYCDKKLETFLMETKIFHAYLHIIHGASSNDKSQQNTHFSISAVTL